MNYDWDHRRVDDDDDDDAVNPSHPANHRDPDQRKHYMTIITLSNRNWHLSIYCVTCLLNSWRRERLKIGGDAWRHQQTIKLIAMAVENQHYRVWAYMYV